MANGITEITIDNFQEKVVQSDIPVVIDFWASWCGPCRMFAPVFEEVAAEYQGKALFAKINVDEQEELAAKFKVMSIPTILVLSGGNIKNKSMGVMPKDKFVAFVESSI